MMTRTRFNTAVLVLVAVGLGGCWRPIQIAKVPPSTAQERVEFELVTNADLAWQGTSPRLAGRHAFKQGADQLLVITRITSVAQNPKVRDGARIDRYVERLWITIPLGAPLGSEINLYELEKRFLLGYDRNERDEGFYIRPCRTTGKVTLLEKRPDSAVVRIDARVAPFGISTWQVNEKIDTVAQTTDGIHATKLELVRTYHPDPLAYPLTDTGSD